MKNFLEIKPNIGFGDFEFGDDTQKIIDFFGNPDETEVLSDEDFEAKVITYWEKGFTFFLEGEKFSHFTCVESDNENITLFGKKIIGMQEVSLLSLMKDNGHENFEAEEEEWGEKRISFDELSLDFYLENDEVVSISWASPDIEDDIDDEEEA